MREIKFRVWDKEFKRMKVSGMGINKGVLDGDDIEIMQYTGLKDKNSREIYEGDIFEYVTPISHSKYRKSVQYEESEACWILWDGNPDNQQSRLKSGLASHGVVIGNIYENPYLLKP